ncbi:peptidase domain-containing ABC transporter [Motilimonas sp. E26]|uniref:peptidase domain-containing ABC transporter n=1 Tax=Motilimonas sp. E26 TaxID=2865674 RepID=UPI001E3B4188|nr:peptidase domain-containing ABC transporter [Motilimonas sp. E26]MCE0557245.1 peptidase domain-containing ABC transporter [Motilimonas sp. E26]
MFAKSALDKLKLSGHSRLSVVRQTEAAECGLASLTMIAAYYGYDKDLISMRRQFSVSTHGLNLKQLMEMARTIGLSCRALTLELSELKELQLPCVLHWDMNHFIVLAKVGRSSITVHDPAAGKRKIALADVGKHFTGIAMELSPTSEFKQIKEKKKLTISQFWSSITGIKRNLVQVLCLSIFLQGFIIIAPFYMQTVVDDVILRSDSNLLLVLTLGFVLMMLIRISTSWIRQIVILRLSSQLNIQMAANLFRHLIFLPLDYFEKRHIGDVVSRFGSLQAIRSMLTSGLVSAFIDGLMAVITLTAMFVYSPKLALVVLLVVAIYGAIRALLYRPLRNLTEESINAGAKHDSVFMESIRGIQTIKLFQKEGDRQNLWQNRLADSMNADIRIAKWNITYGNINSVLFGLENFLVIYLAAMAVMENTMSLGMLYAFLTYKNQFVDRMDGIINQFINFKMLGLHLERLADIAYSEKERGNQLLMQDKSEIKGDISVKNLSFSYGEMDQPVFSNVSLDIKSGETVAITGSSGCGKSTLIKCLMGLFTPSAGEILIDGTPLHQLPGYRQQIAAVMQEDQLFAGSIAENIACFDAETDIARVQESAFLAAVHDEIMNLPMQYNTLVGDMGSSLSGGQKQRIILARALYRKPRILFMDEATSHLDINNEEKVNTNIKGLNITRVIVAHRPETIASADRKIDFIALCKKSAETNT